ncbi:diguanylate cyclase [Alteromonadaceae bacterium BrNp21-10]|nr:diguanylate cyclase [Alteromonadaceae bacterium BrNp21-10]
MANQQFEAKLKELRQLFILTLPEKLDEIFALWNSLSHTWNLDDCKKCAFELHSLKGSSGTLGYTDISNAFSDCEKVLKDLSVNEKGPNQDNMALLEQAFIQLTQSQEALLNNNQQPQEVSISDQRIAKNLQPTLRANEVNIVVIDDETSAGQLMQKLLAEFSFNVRYFQSLSQAKPNIEESPPHIVMLDLMMPECSVEHVFDYAKELEAKDIKTFIVTAHNNFETRLSAVRANVTDYVVKPYQITGLVAKIRHALQMDLVRPSKICLVDDQQSVASYFKSTLEAYGMDVMVVVDPKELLKALEEFEPDIFLLDLFMPEVNGFELAKIIRHLEKYNSIPIVFLTSENTIETKIDILEIGCDDVLPKNMPPDMLVKQITSRLMRGKSLRYLTSRDSLTGLLNHGQIMEAAQNSVLQGNRRGVPAIVAMVDLDYFKKVNDTYGHSAGDKVLMGLGQLLLQHVRQTDYVGRYGGEEFMLVFPDANLDVVKLKIDHIREALQSINFKHENKSFNVTFSAGIASSNDYKDLKDIVIGADKALYEAKRLGRNNTQLAQKSAN